MEISNELATQIVGVLTHVFDKSNTQQSSDVTPQTTAAQKEGDSGLSLAGMGNLSSIMSSPIGAMIGEQVLQWVRTHLTTPADKTALQNLEQNPNSQTNQTNMISTVSTYLQNNPEIKNELSNLVNTFVGSGQAGGEGNGMGGLLAGLTSGLKNLIG